MSKPQDKTLDKKPKTQTLNREAKHGNFRSYSKRRLMTTSSITDRRLEVIQPCWIQGKRVLDIGCNEGSFTFQISMKFNPIVIVGVDIDPQLINKAQKNLKRYISNYWRRKKNEYNHGPAEERKPRPMTKEEGLTIKYSLREQNKIDCFNSDQVSTLERKAPTLHQCSSDQEVVNATETEIDSVNRPTKDEAIEDADEIRDGINENESRSRNQFQVAKPHQVPSIFPFNVHFAVHDMSSDSALPFQIHDPQSSLPRSEVNIDGKYDVILCLSVTKWVHLHGGDIVLKCFFQRLYECLADGGLLILEPQPWKSYKRRKSDPEFKKTVKDIKLHPDKFVEYLTSINGGKFSEARLLSVQRNEKAVAFNRPIYLFKK